MIKVLEIFGEPISRGGQESYVISTIQNMDRTGLKINFFTPYSCDNDKYRTIIKQIDGEIYSAELPFCPGKSRRNIVPSLEKHLRENKYDVAHIHSGSISVLLYASKVCSECGIKKIIVHSHSSGCSESLKHRLIKLFATPYFLKYPTVLCACSVEAAKWKFPASKIDDTIILKNGVDLEKFKLKPEVRDAVRKTLNISSSEFVIGHIGRFTLEKNQVFLLHILKKIKEDKNEKVKLVLVGDGEKRNYVMKIASDLSLEDDVIFVGGVDNPEDYLQAFDVFVFPSKYEGLGIAGVEAQATGLPLVASTGVPHDIKLTDNVDFINLNADLNIWVTKILDYKGLIRTNTTGQIKEKGFDIKDTSNDVRLLYINL